MGLCAHSEEGAGTGGASLKARHACWRSSLVIYRISVPHAAVATETAAKETSLAAVLPHAGPSAPIERGYVTGSRDVVYRSWSAFLTATYVLAASVALTNRQLRLPALTQPICLQPYFNSRNSLFEC